MSELALPARIALVGNPNSGKTALFNALTGSRQKVANYPGVTVERKEGVVVTPAGLTVRLIDLPRTYSLRARSLDEIVTRDVVLGRLAGEDVPRLLVCVADSTNLRLALRLVVELKHVGRPMILALNMFDIARHRGFEIDLDRLSAELGIPVVSSVAVRRGGTRDLLTRIDEVIGEHGMPSVEGTWSEPDAAALRATQRRADRILDLRSGDSAVAILFGRTARPYPSGENLLRRLSGNGSGFDCHCDGPSAGPGGAGDGSCGLWFLVSVVFGCDHGYAPDS